ncbi:phospholipase [Subtercola sp. YIM 133946]|uniref:aggregation-promoting factor C-terminal-like domain-containing protein n=1 Tax=Subtercola sp. YIM 133946 TaxID=3118909 RepID=UPI002F954266
MHPELPTRRTHRTITRTIHPRRTAHDRLPLRRFIGGRMLVATALVTAGLVVGTGFVVQSSVSSAETAAATARTQQALNDTVEKSAVVATAKNTISRAEQVVDQAQAKVDTTDLSTKLSSLNASTSLATLSDYSKVDAQTVVGLTVQTEFESQNIQAAAAQADRIAAEAAAAAAAKAAADAAAAAQAAAEALAAGNTVDGAKATAENLASSTYGWGSDQFSCLVSLWQKESGWSYQALNASSGAAGIPQALPGSKMSSVADDWQTNATTQITWGLAYIAGSYGTPCSAWSHSQSVNWY